MKDDRLRSAGREILDFLVGKYRTPRGVHSETIIGAAAALTADFALRANEPDLPGHGWVVSPRTTEFLCGSSSINGEKPSVWAVLRDGALKAGVAPADLPDIQKIVVRVAKAVGGSPFPPLSVPQDHYPHEWSPNASPRFRDDIQRIAEKHGLTTTETALALGHAISMLLSLTNEAIPPSVSLKLVLEIMLGVSRMAPLQTEI